MMQFLKCDRKLHVDILHVIYSNFQMYIFQHFNLLKLEASVGSAIIIGLAALVFLNST